MNFMLKRFSVKIYTENQLCESSYWHWDCYERLSLTDDMLLSQRGDQIGTKEKVYEFDLSESIF